MKGSSMLLKSSRMKVKVLTMLLKSSRRKETPLLLEGNRVKGLSCC